MGKTGIRVGKKPETLSIYDKAKKHNLDSDWTKMEIQLYGKKLPTKELDKLYPLILGMDFNPLINIELFNLEILPFNR